MVLSEKYLPYVEEHAGIPNQQFMVAQNNI